MAVRLITQHSQVSHLWALDWCDSDRLADWQREHARVRERRENEGVMKFRDLWVRLDRSQTVWYRQQSNTNSWAYMLKVTVKRVKYQYIHILYIFCIRADDCLAPSKCLFGCSCSFYITDCITISTEPSCVLQSHRQQKQIQVSQITIIFLTEYSTPLSASPFNRTEFNKMPFWYRILPYRTTKESYELDIQLR